MNGGGDINVWRKILIMRYGSVCSGIEAATMAWKGLGWEAAFFSEIDPFPCAVLTHHYPETPLHGDFTTIGADEYGSIDILVGGTPCQSFSVAGLRKGMDDERGNLALEFIKLIERKRPEWVVWENVPGVLSSNGGRDFGSFLGALAEVGYGFAYRVLDAQFFGVAQRRRRVFVVASRTSWQRAAAVLFERESLFGDFEKGKKARENASRRIKSSLASGKHETGTLMACHGSKLWLGDQEAFSGDYRIIETYRSSSFGQFKKGEFGTLKASGGDLGGGSETFVVEPIPLNSMTMMGLPSDNGRKGSGIGIAGEPVPTITSAHHHAICTPVAPPLKARGHKGINSDDLNPDSCAIVAHSHQNNRVRRLTPIECERLQGFPDDYTLIPYRNKPADKCPDGPRYKALGNSMAVPVMKWIGERIQKVESLKESE